MRRDAFFDGRSDGHAFRKRLPRIRAAVRKQEDDSDLKLFALSFAAFFVCFSTFLL